MGGIAVGILRMWPDLMAASPFLRRKNVMIARVVLTAYRRWRYRRIDLVRDALLIVIDSHLSRRYVATVGSGVEVSLLLMVVTSRHASPGLRVSS